MWGKEGKSKLRNPLSGLAALLDSYSHVYSHLFLKTFVAWSSVVHRWMKSKVRVASGMKNVERIILSFDLSQSESKEIIVIR